MDERDKQPAVFECAVLFADKPSVHGHIYSVEALQKIVEDFKAQQKEGIDVVAVVGDKPQDFGLDIEKLRIAAVVPSLHVHDGALRATIETIDTTAGHLLNQELRKSVDGKSSVRVFPICQLKLHEKNVLACNLSHFGITAAEGVSISFGERLKEFNTA